jgi:hypothetical protein
MNSWLPGGVGDLSGSFVFGADHGKSLGVNA